MALASRSWPALCSYQAQQQQEQQGENLIKWVRHNGGQIHPSLRLQSSSGSGMSLVSTRPLLAGSPLITLPPQLPLTFPNAPVTDSPDHMLLRLAQLVPEELWALKLGLKLLMERAQTGSFWWPYISNLPQRFNHPIFFTGAEIANLQYAPVIYQVKKRCKALLELSKDVEAFVARLPDGHHPFRGQEVTASSLGWAMAAVSSRAFHAQGPSGAHRAMLPLIDMCNHSFTPNARITQQAQKDGASFEVVAEKHLPAGSDILLSYGSLSNDVLLLDYGFVVPGNQHDVVEVRYDRALLDAARVAAKLHEQGFLEPLEWQQSLLEQWNLEGVGAALQVKFGGPNLVDGRLLAALRVLYAPEPDVLQDKDASMLQTWSNSPLGNEIESKTLKTLIAMCALLLGHFPTTASEDEAVLQSKDKDLSEGTRLVLNYRMAKKKVLVDCIHSLSRRLACLGNVAASSRSGG